MIDQPGVETPQVKRPTRGRPPQMSIEERRRRLVEAAFEVAASAGVLGMTTRAVTKQAGMPHGAFHYAFDGKADLIHAMFTADRDSGLAGALEKMMQAETPQEAIGLAALGAWSVMNEERSKQVVLMQLSQPPLGADEEWVELARRAREISIGGFREALEAVAQRYEVRWAGDTESMATLAYYLLDVSLMMSINGEGDPVEALTVLSAAMATKLETDES